MSEAASPARRLPPAVWGLGLALVLHGICLAVFASASPHSRWDLPLDDAWIHQVYARALASGDGLAYNEGQPEAGATSPLWILATAPVHLLPASDDARVVVAGVKIIGALCALWAVLLAWRIAYRLTASAGAAATAASVLATEPRLAFAALSGMETPLLVALWLLALERGLAGRPRAVMATLGLLPLVRPEAVVCVPFGMAALWMAGVSPRFWRRPLPWLLVVAPALAWALVCKAMVDTWLPNSFYFKATAQPLSAALVLNAAKLLLQHGWGRSELLFLGTLVGWTGWLAWRGGRPGRAALILAIAAPAAYLLAVVASRPVELHGYYWTRWADPAALVATSAFGLAAGAAIFTAPRRAGIAAALLLLVAALPAWPSFVERRARLASDGRVIREMNVAAGQWLDANLPPEAVVGVNDAGALRYFGKRRTIDILGLNYADLLHGRVAPGRVIEELDWVAIFPDALPGAEERFEERAVFHVPIWEYTICHCPGQTRLWIGESKASRGSEEPRVEAPAGAPSMLVISIDTLRADHLSSYGYARPTPHMDALATRGVLYEEAHSPAPWTLPSHASLLTGLYPVRHGLVDQDRTLPQGVETLAQRLSQLGYRSAAFVSTAYISDIFGLDRGFDDAFVSLQYENSGQVSTSNLLGDTTIERAVAYLRESRDDPRPFFVFVHLFDPHWPYAAPPPYRGRYSAGYRGEVSGDFEDIFPYASRADLDISPEDLAHLVDLYDEEVAWSDHLVGQLVAEVRAAPRGRDAVIVLTSDHGEEFMDHGSLGHALTLYREQSHVPLIVSAPGRFPSAERVVVPVSTLDVAPTLLLLAGVDADAPALRELNGRPLPGWGHPAETDDRRRIVMHTTRWGPARMAVRAGDWKVIAPMRYEWGVWADEYAGEWLTGDTLGHGLEAYDLAHDPGETRPLPPKAGGEVLRALRELEESRWRGIRIEVSTPVPLRLGLRLPEAARFRDEPALYDGLELKQLPLRIEQEVELTAPGRWVVRLPVVPGGRASLHLRVEGAAESVLHLAGGERVVVPGEEVALDLVTANGTGPLSATAEGRPQIAVRARSWGIASRAPELDDEVREALEALGYADP